MISAVWLDKRRPHWARLEELVARSGRGLSALHHRELQELAVLYRQVATDLATVREDASSQQTARYLNQLLGRAHNLIYMGRRTRPRGILHFYARTYPEIFRATLAYTLMAFFIFLGAALAGFFLSLASPVFPRHLLGHHMTDTIERREMWTHSIVTIKPLASSSILTNNLSVVFTIFALGISAGLGTLWMLLLNGLLLGTVTAACFEAGLSLQFWSFVAPHGVLELPAIFIAGGAGLLLARGLLFPGLLPRRASLVCAGGQAVRLVLGAVPLLVVAGFIEGFLSPSDLPLPAKFLAALAFAGLLALYLGRGRTARAAPPCED